MSSPNTLVAGALRHRAGRRPSSGRPGFRLDVQGLRALAVGSVTLYHAHLPLLTGGYVGVDVFFVISGFLITSHLLRDVLTRGRLDFGRFYARRARRILPASFAVLLATLVAAVFVVPPAQLRQVAHDAVMTALYVPNWAYAAGGTDYLAQSDAPSLFQHYWSLGVEEQFYLVWPLLLVVAFALVRRRKTRLAGVLGAIAVVSFLLCVVLTRTSEPWAFFGLHTRAWEFAAGGLVALLLSGRWRLPRSAATVAGWLGVAALAWSLFAFTDATEFPGAAAAVPVLGTALVILGGASAPPHGPGALLSWRPAVFLGEISYSLYLVHWPVLTLAQAAVGAEHPLRIRYTLLLAVLCVPLAWVLYRYVENPLRRSARLSALPARATLTSALAGSLVAVVAAAGVFGIAVAAPTSTSRTVRPTAATLSPDATPFVPANLQPALDKASTDNPAVYADGCHLEFSSTAPPGDCRFGTNAAAPHVLLFGDSHAAQWFPALDALADDGAISLQSVTKSGCPAASISVDFTSQSGPIAYPQCEIWRDAMLKKIAADPPQLIVLSDDSAPPLPDGGTPTAAQWQQAVAQTLSQLPKQSRVLVIGDTPLPGTPPSACLSAHLDDAASCALPKATAVRSDFIAAERAAAKAAHAQFADVDDYLCNDTSCPSIISNRLVYRDGSHLTATAARSLAPELGRAVRAALG
jgi:peptidoglycan/LPS O-acetylase OafA/YrhL